MVENIYNLVEILDRDVVKNGDGVTPFQFKLSYSDGKAVDLKDKRVYVSFASTTTYLFKKKADVDKDGVISITLNDDDPIIEGNTEIEISVESSNGKSQKFPSQDGEHSAFVYISKSIESLNSRVISTYTLKQFSDKIDILMDDLDKKYDDHLDNLKKDVGDYIDNSVEDKVDEIKAVAKESMDASIKASKDSIAASLTAENNVKANSTKAVADINSTATKATIDINKVSADTTKKITDTSNTAVATVNAKGDEVLKAFTENGQVPKITADTGAPRYDLNSTKDLFAEILTWGNGFFTFYLSAGATNNPTGTTSWLRGTASTYGKNSNVLAYDKDGAMYTAVCANGVWRTWGKAQMYKTTEDDGSSLTLAGYDLLNTSDVANFDGYVTTATNSPTTSSSGYFKRKYRAGYIEITFSPHTSKEVYRNSYNGVTKVWVGWEKIISQSDTVTYQKQKITNDDGSTIVIANYDLLNTTDVTNFDGYSNTAINMPTGVSQAGYIKRKYRGGLIEVTYSPYNTNAVYRNSYNSVSGGNWLGWEKLVTASELAALESKVNTSEVNTSKPVTLWSGSANGVSSTPYALSRAINTSRKIRVTYDFSGGSGHVAVFDPSIAKTLSIQEFNLVNSDPSGGGFYELELDIAALNSFKISTDSLKDFNGTATIAKNAYTVRKLEEFD